MWTEINRAHDRIDQVRLDVANMVGGMQTDLATIKAKMITQETLEKYLDRKADRSEEEIWRRRDDDRFTYVRGIPSEQREIQNLRANQTQATAALWALGGVGLGILVEILFGILSRL